MIVYDPRAQADATRGTVCDALVEAIDLAATYAVVSNNYVRNGGDGYAMFEDAANAYDFGPDLDAAIDKLLIGETA